MDVIQAGRESLRRLVSNPDRYLKRIVANRVAVSRLRGKGPVAIRRVFALIQSVLITYRRRFAVTKADIVTTAMHVHDALSLRGRPIDVDEGLAILEVFIQSHGQLRQRFWTMAARQIYSNGSMDETVRRRWIYFRRECPSSALHLFAECLAGRSLTAAELDTMLDLRRGRPRRLPRLRKLLK